MSWYNSLPASRAQKRYACPGSHYLESLYPQEESESAKEGTLAHKIAAQWLNVLIHGIGIMPDIPLEMVEHISLYVKDVQHEFKKGIEKFPYFFDGIEEHFTENGGVTSASKSIIDFYLILENATCREIYIWDFKYGHKNIEAVNNFQLFNYASAIMNKIKENHFVLDSYENNHKKQNTFFLKIVQPRVFTDEKIKSWIFNKHTYNEIFDMLQEKEYQALQDHAPCYVTEECFTCNARHACSTLREASFNIIEIASNTSPYVLPSNEIGEELRLLEYSRNVLDARINGLKQQALQYLKKGERVNFYKLQQSTGRLNWDIPIEKLKELEQLTDINLIKEEPVTPKQAIEKGIPEELIAKYTSRKSGEIKIVPQSESQLTKIFNQEN